MVSRGENPGKPLNITIRLVILSVEYCHNETMLEKVTSIKEFA